MSDFVRGKSDNLYDPITGAWRGVMDKNGKEQVLTSSTVKSLYYDLLAAFNSKRGKNPLELTPLASAASAAAATDLSPYVEYGGAPTGPTTPTEYNYFSGSTLALDTNSKYWLLNGLPVAGNATNGFLANYTGAKYVQINGARTAVATWANTVGGAMLSFEVKAPIVQINVGGSTYPYRLAINNRWATYGNTNQSGRDGIGTAGFGQFTITHASSKWRRYDLEFTHDARVQKIVIGAADKIRALPAWRRTVLFLGDSFMTTVIGGIQNDELPQMLRHITGVNIIGHGLGGSGFVGGTNPADNTFRLDDAALALPDLIVCTLGLNDAGQSSAAVTANALLTLQGLRSRMPTTPIITMLYGAARDNDAPILAAEDAVAAAVAKMADPLIKQIRTVGSTRKLLYGSDVVGRAGTVGNASHIIGGDGVDFTHPSGDGGTEELARETWSLVLDAVNEAGW